MGSVHNRKIISKKTRKLKETHNPLATTCPAISMAEGRTSPLSPFTPLHNISSIHGLSMMSQREPSLSASQGNKTESERRTCRMCLEEQWDRGQVEQVNDGLQATCSNHHLLTHRCWSPPHDLHGSKCMHAWGQAGASGADTAWEQIKS